MTNITCLPLPGNKVKVSFFYFFLISFNCFSCLMKTIFFIGNDINCLSWILETQTQKIMIPQTHKTKTHKMLIPQTPKTQMQKMLIPKTQIQVKNTKPPLICILEILAKLMTLRCLTSMFREGGQFRESLWKTLDSWDGFLLHEDMFEDINPHSAIDQLN